MAPKKAASKVIASSNAYACPVTRSRSQGVEINEDRTPGAIANIIVKLIEKSSKDKVVVKDNPLFDQSTPAGSQSKTTSNPDVMSVMMADVDSDERMVEMERKINLLMKAVEERDQEIAYLKNQMQSWEVSESSQILAVKKTDKGKTIIQDDQP